MATIQQIIDDIQDATGALTDIRSAPDEPPDNAAAFPFVVAFASGGRYHQLAEFEMQGLHSIIVQLHVSHTNLPTDVAKAMTYAKAIPNAIFSAFSSDLLAGTVSAIEAISYTFGGMKYADTETLGFEFIVEGIKTRDAIT